MIRSIIDSAPVFVEHSNVTAIISALVSDENYRRFQNELMEDPERGDVIQGTGGFRKARMRLAGGGKSGGARVIYLYFPRRHAIFIGAIYKKSKRENLTDHEKEILKGAARDIKAHFKLG